MITIGERTMCPENKSGRWRRIVCMNVMEGRKEIHHRIPTRVNMIGHSKA